MKNAKQMMLLGLAYFGSSTVLIDASGRDSNVCTNMIAGNQVQGKGQTASCTGGGGKGATSIATPDKAANAAGDKVFWNINYSQVKNEQWGSIKNTEHKVLKFPKSGEKKLITLTPTEGKMKNKSIDVLIVPFDKRAKNQYGEYPDNLAEQLQKLDENTQYNTIIKFYRKNATETNWTELYELFSDEKSDSRKLHFKVAISPDGILTGEQKMILTNEETGAKQEVMSFSIDLTAFE